MAQSLKPVSTETSSIKVAEAAKVIENTQRDLNIAFVNELALLFDRLGIDTNEVLDAAETKWNFLKFRPGLVGGHCIGVDPLLPDRQGAIGRLSARSHLVGKTYKRAPWASLLLRKRLNWLCPGSNGQPFPKNKYLWIDV